MEYEKEANQLHRPYGEGGGGGGNRLKAQLFLISIRSLWTNRDACLGRLNIEIQEYNYDLSIKSVRVQSRMGSK